MNPLLANFSSSIERCIDVISLKKVHARIVTHGFKDHINLGCKLLNVYANFGGLSESRYIFDKIVNRNLSLWNSAIVGYFRARHFNEVLRLYCMLKLEDIGIDSSVITFGLKSCTEVEDVEMGRGIHVDAFKVGLNGDKFVGSSLIGLYFRCGSIAPARQAFDEILDKDIVVYTAMITGYAQLSDSQAYQAFEIARSMQKEGLDANRVTLVCLLQASGQLKALREGKSIHCYALKRYIGCSDEVFKTSLVDMYGRCGAISGARFILVGAGSSVASWNALIASLIHSDRSLEALKSFFLMVKESMISPDPITFANILTAYSDLNYTHQVSVIHGYLIRREIQLDLVVTTTIIDLYSRCGKVKEARLLFDQLVHRDVVLYNVLISGYLQNNDVNEGIRMFEEMINSGIRPNSVTMLGLLSAFADLRDVREGKCIYGIAVKYGFLTDTEVSNLIIHMYAKWGCTETSRKFFNSMDKKDLVSWTSMMIGYVNSGKADEALTLFHSLNRNGKKPDSITIITLLQALSQMGCLEKVKETHGYIYRAKLVNDAATMNSIIITYARCGSLDTAEAVFSSLEKRESTTWNTMIAAYGIHGFCRDALDLFEKMPKENIFPDGMTLTSVLSACSHGGLVEEGWKIFNSISVPQEEHYNCMVDLLARAGRIEEAYNFIRCSPLRDETKALCALLAACRVHSNTEFGEIIGRELLELEHKNSSIYAIVSNLYSEVGKWNKAASLRSAASERGLRKLPGYSSVELN